MPTMGCDGRGCPHQLAMSVMGCNAHARVQCPQRVAMPMLGCNVCPVQARILHPRSHVAPCCFLGHKESCLSSHSPSTAFHSLFIAAKPFLIHLATTARTQLGFGTAKGTPAHWLLAVSIPGDTPLLQEGSSPRVSPEMSPSLCISDGCETCPYLCRAGMSQAE